MNKYTVTVTWQHSLQLIRAELPVTHPISLVNSFNYQGVYPFFFSRVIVYAQGLTDFVLNIHLNLSDLWVNLLKEKLLS